MLQRLRRASLVWPTALSVAGLAVLIGLGTWQLQRKQWKDALIARIAARITARGRLHHDKERYLYAPAKSGLGWHVYTPLEWAPSQLVWINRGFVPDERKDPASRREGQLPGEVEVTGLVRVPHGTGLFTPANDVARNLWYWPDPTAMHASAFTGTEARALA